MGPRVGHPGPPFSLFFQLPSPPPQSAIYIPFFQFSGTATNRNIQYPKRTRFELGDPTPSSARISLHEDLGGGKLLLVGLGCQGGSAFPQIA